MWGLKSVFVVSIDIIIRMFVIASVHCIEVEEKEESIVTMTRVGFSVRSLTAAVRRSLHVNTRKGWIWYLSAYLYVTYCSVCVVIPLEEESFNTCESVHDCVKFPKYFIFSFPCLHHRSTLWNLNVKKEQSWNYSSCRCWKGRDAER